jgi:hypothetical protein
LGEIPSAIFINANNKGYCRIKLDKNTIQILRSKITSITNVPNRCYLWRILADQLKLLTIKPNQFLKAVFDNLDQENEDQIFPFLITECQHVIKYYTRINDRSQVNIEFFEALYKKLKNTTDGQ